jgi:hypothetical protein
LIEALVLAYPREKGQLLAGIAADMARLAGQ